MRDVGEGAPMATPQIAEFLERQSTGALSFASPGDDDPPYSIPVAFGYDAAADSVVMQFLVHGDSEKATYLDDDRPVSLTVYDREYADGYRSVVLTGRLSAIPEDGIPHAKAVFDKYGPNGAVNLFPDRDDYHVEWVALQDAEKTGRQSSEARSIADNDVHIRS
jgi:nitroimidazol reductase NimA-like FMN-containing flavoprotein (pyridoxamine 5'-phosphate oxidase superfamily)